MARQRGIQGRTRPPRTSRVQRVWSELIKPALIITMVGAGAVMYLIACARVSVIECDLGRLERAASRQEVAELELQRQLAALRSADRVQEHIVERGLEPPRGAVHVSLVNVPPSLREVLPAGDSDRDTREIRLGRLPAGADAPLHASGRLIASARTE